jgi:carotenoid 1,2-hydratase
MMKVQLGMQGDFPMRVDAPGTYEWWYFDAIDESRELALTIILFDGMPMSPYWLEALPKANAEDFRGYAISVYRKGKKIAGFIHHVNNHEISITNDECFIQMGDVSMRRNSEKKYQIEIDTYFPDSTTSLQGLFTFTPKIYSESEECFGSGNHCWRLIAPMCQVDGNIILRQYEDEIEELQFSGHGYHDCNSGDDALDADYDDWYWGRLPINDRQTLIYYHYPACSRHDEMSIAFIADSEVGIQNIEHCMIQLSDFRMTTSLMRIAHAISIEGEFLGKQFKLCIDHGETLEFGPFYYRFLTKTKTTNTEFIQSKGISEYFNARRLRSPLVRTMIKTPMHRI